jgi:formylglycine-generating enzyme required for sulfatase activity
MAKILTEEDSPMKVKTSRLITWLSLVLLAVMIVTIFPVGCAGGEEAATQPSAGETPGGETLEPSGEAAPTKEPEGLIMEPTETPIPVTPTPTSAPAEEEAMVYIEGGEFIMGSDDHEPDETPQRKAYVDSFNIDEYQVTNAQYKEFVDDAGHPAPRNWKEGEIPEGKEDHPVTWVTWEDAKAYAEWAGKRLPTEIEWERAARGTDGRIWPWGDEFDSSKCNSAESGNKDTTPVDAYPDGASPDGVMDIAGNVWEWTDSWYDAYPASTHRSDRYGEKNKVIRGGSWFDDQSMVRGSARNKAEPTFMFSTIGFRCAK